MEHLSTPVSRTDARRLSPEAQADLRRRAVLAYRSGQNQTAVARTFGVSRQSVNAWVTAAASNGLRTLRAKPRGRPRGGSLKSWQAAQVAQAVIHHLPDQLRLPFALWTREAVQRLIARRFRVRMSVWTVGRYLQRWGFTPQKPARRAYERNDAAIARWLREEYPKIRNQAKREGATIFWEDETGCRSDHQTGRTYGKRGQTPVVPGTGQRFRCNVISAIANRGELAFMVFRSTFVTAVFLDFLQRLIRHAEQRKVFLIVDGHPVHKAKLVQRWIEGHSDHLRLFFLPPYAPELNPDELLNQDMKTNAVGRKRAADLPTLMQNLRSHLWRRQRQPTIVRRFFDAPHVRYAAR